MNVLVLSGSTRRDSLNSRLAALVASALPEDDVRVRSDLARLPFFDADLEATGGSPSVQELRFAVSGTDLLVLVTPEYNGTVPGVLANAVDWLSRPHRDSPLSGRDVLVLSASPSPGGGRRAAGHLRGVLTRAGAQVRPEALAVPRAQEALQDEPCAVVADIRRAVGAPVKADGTTRSPRQVLDHYLATVAAGRWDELADLYATDAVVEHPFGRSVLRGRDELSRHFAQLRDWGLRLKASEMVVHDTSDPEVIVAEFAYVGSGHEMTVHRRNVFVMSVREGLISASRDYSADVISRL